jgi:CubicO group peptidase (beta-lactamase class C family)
MKLALVTILCIINGLAFAQKTASLQTICDDMSEPYRVAKGFKGLVIAVLDGDSAYYKSYGLAQDTLPIAMSENIKFQIGGATKVLTGIAIAKLISEGVLSLDDPYNTVVADSFKMASADGERITIKQLLTHHSGLPKLPYNFNLKKRFDTDPYCYYQNVDLIEFLQTEMQESSSLSGFQYSNLNYALLGNILSYNNPKSGINYIKTNITNPLKMSNTGFQLVIDTSVAAPHRFDGKASNIWHFGSMHESVGAYSTARDLAILVQKSYTDSTYFNAAWQALDATNIKEVKYASGWQTYTRSKRDQPIITHNGATEGHRCYIAFVPNLKKGVVVLSNSSNPPDQVGIDILGIICQFK